MSPFAYLTLKTLPLVFLSAASTTALATDFLVTTDQDEFDGVCDVHCSLRDAIQAANEQPGADRIQLSGTYLLSRAAPDDSASYDEDDNQTGDLDIADELVIRGRGEAISGIRSEGSNARIFEVLPGARLTLERLQISGGSTPAYGGALENHGEAILRRVTLSDNQAKARSETDPSSGGAIANFGTLEIFSSRLIGNKAEGIENPSFAGALYNQGQLLVRDSLFADNRGGSDYGFAGALYNSGMADIARSAFVNNWTPEFGNASAILNEKAGVLKVSNATFSQNNALAAVILNKEPTREGTPSLELINVSIVDNLGVGVRNGGRLRIRNSLIAGIKDEIEGYSNPCWNFGNHYQFEARGLLLGSAFSNCPADRYIDDAEALTRLVEPLSSVDERTYVHALRENSPALDAGVGSCAGHDQRRQPRPLDGDGDGVAVCDLGAYEWARP
nr:CSLREA domain-containing protein [uncultured Pseudomonas sp.]